MKKYSILVLAILLLSIPLSTFSHSGRTDSSGGHRDNKNKSGLGSYHYHCGGHPPHLHNGGVCPYLAKAITKTTPKATPKPTPKIIYPASIEISNTPTTLELGNSVNINYKVLPENADNKQV